MKTQGRAHSRARRLRREMTLPEILLWSALRRRQLDGFKFRRQHPLGPYVLDFYCADQKLCVEVDGWGHNMGPIDRDERRDAHLVGEGIRTLRFPADLVLSDVEAVVNTIIAECLRAKSSPCRWGGGPREAWWRGLAPRETPSRPSAVLPHLW